MALWRAFEEVPADLGPTVVTIGNFDGVHRGHRAVIARARQAADEREVPLVAITFDPHPMAVLRPDHAPSMLTTLTERAELLAEVGVDHVLAIPFDQDIAGWTPQEFVDRVILGSLHAQVVVVGANFRFGSRAAGDVSFLTEAGRAAGFEAIGVELDGGPQVWSSTYVRTCLAAGDVSGAAEALGRPFTVRGVVVRGDQRGRELGYPTANVPVDATMAVPADGVYAGWLRDRGARSDEPSWPVAISVGTNPTFDGHRERRVESYVLDRTDLDLYGLEVEVTFVERIRGMVRFDSVDSLLVEMGHDVEQTRELLDLG